jgi:hypothetical protein
MWAAKTSLHRGYFPLRAPPVASPSNLWCVRAFIDLYNNSHLSVVCL